MNSQPWRGVLVAPTVPFNDDLSINYDRYQDHLQFLVDNGIDGVVPNGSLGEYQVLSDEERARLVDLAVEVAPAGFAVIPGVGAFGSAEGVRWTEQARRAGADAVLSLPPNAYQANDDEVVAHYRDIARVGLPIVAYNNPFDTRVDLTPKLLQRVAEIDEVVAIKEFSCDVRRISQIMRAVPDIDVLCGSDDLVVEAVLMGAAGWLGGFSSSLPAASVAVYELASSDQVEAARNLYALLQPAFEWDSKHIVVQAVKLSLDVVGGFGGVTRPPRLPLSEDERAQITRDVELAMTAIVAA